MCEVDTLQVVALGLGKDGGVDQVRNLSSTVPVDGLKAPILRGLAIKSVCLGHVISPFVTGLAGKGQAFLRGRGRGREVDGFAVDACDAGKGNLKPVITYRYVCGVVVCR